MHYAECKTEPALFLFLSANRQFSLLTSSQIIYEHTLIDVVMDGTNKTYNTWCVKFFPQ
jgi:hypothetical protein